MKFSVIKNWKLFLIITLSVLVVGMLVFGICGFNQSVNNKDNYELQVSVDSYTPSTEESGSTNTGSVLENAVESYFEKNNINPVSYSEQKLIGDGLTLVYKFNDDITDSVSSLTSFVQGKIDSEAIITGLTVSSDFKYVGSSNDSFISAGWIYLAMGVAAVALFVYNLFIEKVKGALSVLASSVLSILLFIAVLSIVRIPAGSFVGIMLALSFLVPSVLSSTMVDRFKEQLKTVKVEKIEEDDQIDKETNASIIRLAFTGLAILFVSLLLIIIGPASFRFVGLQLIVCDIVSIFSTFVCTPLIYSVLNKKIK